MAADRRTRVLIGVWALLVAATVVSFWVGHDHTGTAIVVTVLAITFGKIWLVGREFMELRTAPPGLRRAYDAYAVVVPVALAALYLAG